MSEISVVHCPLDLVMEAYECNLQTVECRRKNNEDLTAICIQHDFKKLQKILTSPKTRNLNINQALKSLNRYLNHVNC